MLKFLRLALLRLWPWYRHRYLYVIADPKDNSITLSRALFEHMDVMKQQQAKVFVFQLCNIPTNDTKRSGALYAFALNPPFCKPTQLADIQYNAKHHTIGFESLCPTVNRVLYDYGLPSDLPVKLSVIPAIAPATTLPASPQTATVPEASASALHYYIILPPHDITHP